MKIFIKTLKDTHFEIEVNPEDTVGDVKKHIETVQGPNKYGAVHQMLIHQGKVLQNHTTLRDNKVAENHFLVIMLTKTKGSRGEGSSVSAAPTAKVPTSDCLVAPSLVPDPVSPAPESLPTPAPTPEAALPPAPITAPASALPPTLALPPIPAPTTASVTVPETCSHDQATSNLVAATNFNQTVQDILDMGGGFWDRDTVVRALQAAYNNPETAVEYLCSGLPERADVPPVARAPASGQPANAASHTPAQSSPVPSSRPYTNPLDHLPQGFPIANSGSGGAGVLEFLRHSPQIQALGAIVQANPQMLQPMLQELGKQNPLVVRLIQEHEADFLRLINEPIEGGESSNIHQQLNAGTPQAIQVTPAEREAIERLEAMGFYRATVLEVYFACNKNEELAANYLLDHMHDFED